MIKTGHQSKFQAFSMEILLLQCLPLLLQCLPSWHTANPPYITMVSTLLGYIMSHESCSTGVKTCASILTPVAGCAMRCTNPQTHVTRDLSTFEALPHHIPLTSSSYVPLKIAIHNDFISNSLLWTISNFFLPWPRTFSSSHLIQY